MIVIANTLVILLIFIGVIFTVVAVVGVLRLPDVYTRSHAATKSVTFGVLCTLSGVFLYFWLIEGDFNIKLLLGIVFLFITAPIGGHIMARAAYISNVKPSELTSKDDLKEVVEQAKKDAVSK
jgi:multicomponent Na+:H+ antiporter subunit G